METYHALILGMIQGLTEFLPVSSSGHLALGQYIFGIKESTLFFDISLHIGTLIAVVIIFFDNIKTMFISIIQIFQILLKFNLNLNDFNKHVKENPDIRLLFLIIVGSVPTAIIGLFLKQYVDALFDSINFVGTMLIITGTFLWLTRGVKIGDVRIDDSIMNFGYKQAFFIGFCQGIAVVPGISRSGATIAAGLFAGIKRETAAKFSFLLSIPAIIGAELLGLKDILIGDIGAVYINMATLYGTFIAFVVGYVALKVLLNIVKIGKLHFFGPYCWILGVIAIVSGVL